jgi:hypothetical protein
MAELELKLTADSSQADQRMSKMQEELAKIQAISEHVRESLAKIQEGKEGPDQVTEGMRGLSDESEKAGESVNRVNENLGETKGHAEEAADGIKKMLEQFAATATAVIGIRSLADGIRQVAAESASAYEKSLGLGVNVKDYTELAYAVERLGGTTQALDMSMRGLARNAFRAVEDSSGAMAERFRELDIELIDVHGNLRPLTELFYDTAIALSEVDSGTKRAAIAAELLKVRSIDMLAVFAAGPEMFKENLTAAKEMHAGVSEQVGKMADDFDDRMKDIKTSWKAALREMIPEAELLSRVLLRGVQAMAELLKGAAGREDILGGAEGIIGIDEADRLKEIFDSLPKSLQIKIEGLDTLDERIKRLQGISFERRMRDLPAEEQTSIREQIQAFRAERIGVDRDVLDTKVVALRTKLIEEAEARLKDAREDTAAAAIRAAEAEAAMVQVLEQMVAQGSLDITRPMLKWGTSEIEGGGPALGGSALDRSRQQQWNAYMDELQSRRGQFPRDEHLAGGQLFVEPGKDAQRDADKIFDANKKAWDKFANEWTKAYDKWLDEIKKGQGPLQIASEGLDGLAEALSYMNSEAARAAAGIVKLAQTILDFISNISAPSKADTAAEAFKAVSGFLPTEGGGKTSQSSQSPSSERAAKDFNDGATSLKNFSTVLSMSKSPLDAVPTRIGGGVAPLGQARTDIVPGIGNLWTGFTDYMMPGMAVVSMIGSTAGSLLSWMFGNNDARKKVQAYRERLNREINQGGYLLHRIRQNGGVIDEYPVDLGSGEMRPSGGGDLRPASSTIVNVNVKQGDTMSAVEFYRSESFRRAMGFAQEVRAVD